jgi:proteasome beta subunit
VFCLDGGGGVLSDEYAAGGSGMQVAYGVLERQYEPGLSTDAATGVAARAIDGASERDTASGNGMPVAVVDEEGVAVDEYDAVEEVAE